MSIVDFLPQAAHDLQGIGLYIAQNNVDAAHRTVNEIEGRCALIAAFLTMGVAHPELAPDLRSFPAGNYVIYYRPIENGIEVVRVLHHARAVEGLF